MTADPSDPLVAAIAVNEREEVTLSGTVGDADVKHLHWPRDKLGDDMLAALTTGTTAYRRADGIGVVPLALLGP